MTVTDNLKFKVGDHVTGVLPSAQTGEVRAAFTTKNGHIRYVVENDETGDMEIYSAENMQLVKE